MNIDDELRAALRREPAPKDFAATVLARARGPSAGTRVRRRLWRSGPLTLALAAAIAVAGIVPAVVVNYERREEAKGLKAKQDLLTALAITRDQLRRAGEKVQHRPGEIQ